MAKSKITESKGRIGEPQEYVEFSTKYGNVTAQRVGSHWMVFYTQQGEHGIMRYIQKGYDATKESATAYAKQLATDVYNGKSFPMQHYDW